MRGRTLVVAVVALLSVFTATAVAAGHRVVIGTGGTDELTMGSAGDRVSARGGDDTVNGGGGNDRLRGGNGDDDLSGGEGNDRLRGGQGEDHLDGGEGNDYLNGRGDGGDPDEIVCGAGADTAVLGRNDVIGGDGCEKVRRPGAPRTCASRRDGCEAARTCVATTRECTEDDNLPCVSGSKRCDGPVEEPCVATLNRDCDDPLLGEPEADPAARAPKPREPGA